MISHYEQEVSIENESYLIPIPKDWQGVEDGKVQIIIDDLCVVVPTSILGSTGEVLVLKLLEHMIESGIIEAGDIQKALEHLV